MGVVSVDHISERNQDIGISVINCGYEVSWMDEVHLRSEVLKTKFIFETF